MSDGRRSTDHVVRVVDGKIKTDRFKPIAALEMTESSSVSSGVVWREKFNDDKPSARQQETHFPSDYVVRGTR